MSTVLCTTPLVCPGCGTAQDPPAEADKAGLAVAPCQHCRINLVLVSPSTTAAPRPNQPAPRSAVMAMGILCFLGYLSLLFMIYGASYGVKQLPPYKIAESFVAQHPVVTEGVGEPITFGWFPAVHMQSRGRKGSAYVDLSVAGPRSSARIAVSLAGDRTDWTVREARYQLGGGDASPLWVQFPGDHELLDQLEAVMTEMDRATNDRDVDAMMDHIAPNAQFRFILELPKGREVRTFRTREDYRRETLASVLLTRDLTWDRRSTEFQLAPDGRTATGIIEGTQTVVAEGRALAFNVQETLTYSLDGKRPLITSIDAVQQLSR